MGAAKFIGLDNFKEIAADPMVKQAILHNIEWLLVFITVPLILGFVVAIIVSQLNRGQMIFRTTFFIPYVISAAVAGKIWTAYMNPYYGFNQVFAKLGDPAVFARKYREDKIMSSVLIIMTIISG